MGRLKSFSMIGTAAVMAAVVASPVYANGNPYGGGWSNCTYGAWQALYDATGIALPGFGNASGWLYAAQPYGYETGLTPVPGSIAVYGHHVAYVSAVDGDSVYIIEGGFNGGRHERWVSAWGTGTQSLQGYIYTNAGVASDRTADEAYVEEAPVTPAEETVEEPAPEEPAPEESEEEPTSEIAELDAAKETSELFDGINVYVDDVEDSATKSGVVTTNFDSTIPLAVDSVKNSDTKITGKQLLSKFK